MEGMSSGASTVDALNATALQSSGMKATTLKRESNPGASMLPCNEPKNTIGVNSPSSMSTELDSRVVVTLLHKDGLFSCQTCDMKTTSSKGFDEHIARHILAKPYVCLNCMVKFESKVETDKHAASVHKDEQLRCALQGIKKICQIMTKLKQNGTYTFKGICRKKCMTGSKTSPASLKNDIAGLESSTSVAGSGLSTSVAGSGLSTSVAGSGMSASIVGFGLSTSVAGSGLSTLVAGSGISTSIAGSGISTSVAGSGLSTSVAGSGLSTSVAGSGWSTSVAGSGMSTSVAGSGLSTSVAGSGLSTSVADSGMSTSAAGSGLSTSVAGSGLSTSAAGSGMSTSVACSGMSTSVAGSQMSTSEACSGMASSVAGCRLSTSLADTGSSTSLAGPKTNITVANAVAGLQTPGVKADSAAPVVQCVTDFGTRSPACSEISESLTNNEQIYDTVCQRMSYISEPTAQGTEIPHKDLCNKNLKDSSLTSRLKNIFDKLNACLPQANNTLMQDNITREKECETSCATKLGEGLVSASIVSKQHSKTSVEPTNESRDTVQECEQGVLSFTNKKHQSDQNEKTFIQMPSTVINQSPSSIGKENMVNECDQRNETCLPSTAIDPQTVCKETGILKTLEEQVARKDKQFIIPPKVNEMLKLKVKDMLSVQKNKQKKDSEVPLNPVTTASCVENLSRDKESVEKSPENNSRDNLNCNDNVDEVDDLNGVNSALEEVLSANLPSLYRNKRKATGPEKGTNSTEKSKDCAVSISREEENISNTNVLQAKSLPTSAAGQESREQTRIATTSSTNQKTVVTSGQSGLTNGNSSIREMLPRRSQVDQRYLPGLIQPQSIPVGAHYNQSSHSLSSAEISVNRIQAPNVTVQPNALGQMVRTRRITMLEETVEPVNHFSSSGTPLYTNLPNNGNSQYLNSYSNQDTLQPMDMRVSMPQASHTSTVSDMSNRNTRAVDPPRYPFPYGLPFVPVSSQRLPFIRAPGQIVQLPVRSSIPVTTQSDIGSVTRQRTDVLQNSQFIQIQQDKQQHNNSVSLSVATTNPSCMYSGLRQPFLSHTGGQQQMITYSPGNGKYPQQSALSSQEYANYQQRSAISNQGNANIYQRQTLQGPESNHQNVVNPRPGVQNVQQRPSVSSEGGQRLVPFSSIEAYSNGQQMRVWYPPQGNFQQRPVYQQSELHMRQTGMLPSQPSILRRNHSRVAKSCHKHVSVSQGTESFVGDQSCQTPIYNPEPTRKNQTKKRKSVRHANPAVPEQQILDQLVNNNSPTFSQPSVSNQQAEGIRMQNILGQSQVANSTVNQTITTSTVVNNESNTHQRKQTLHSKDCLDVQISSFEQNTTREVNHSETVDCTNSETETDARESLSCPVSDFDKTRSSEKSGDASNSTKELKSTSSCNKDVKSDRGDLCEEKTDVNRKEKGKKNSKEKNLFTRVGSSFLCNICKIETESAVFFRKHVGMDIHVKKKLCKKCSVSTCSQNDFSNCQMVNIVMNGLRYGSAVTKKIKQEPDEVSISDDDDDKVKDTESVVAEYLKNKSLLKTFQDKAKKTEELTSVVVEEENKGQIMSSQDSDSSSVIYEGMVKTVSPLRMQIKIPQPYKSVEGNSKNKKTMENPSADQKSGELENASTSKSTKVTKQSKDVTLDKDIEKTTSNGKTIYQKPNATAKSTKKTTTGKADHKGDNSEEGKTTLDVAQSHGQQNPSPVEHNEEMSSARQNSQIDKGMAENKCVDQGRPPHAENNTIESNFYICGMDGCKYSCMSSTGYQDHLFVFHRFHDQYKCVHCGLISKRVDEHLRHLHSHLKSNNKYSVFVCAFNMCKYQSNVLKKFIDHFATFHRNEKNFTCFFCKESFSSVENLKEHFERNLLKFVQCPHCTVKYGTREIIVKHINEVHPGMSKKIKVNGQLVCQARGSNHFQQQPLVANRANTQVIEKPIDDKSRNNESSVNEAVGSCRQDNEKGNGSNSIDINQNVPSVEDKSGSVDILLNQKSCAQESSTKGKEPDPSSSETQTEEKTKTNSNRQCSVCSFVGRTIELLKEHGIAHQTKQQQSDKLFQCQVCPQGSETLKAFREHMSCHIGTNKLKILHCTICDFSTNIMDVLTAHLRSTHPSVVQDMDNYILTIEFQTSASLFVCEICQFVTTFEMDFFCHKSEHEKEKEREIFSPPKQIYVRKPFTIPAGENYSQPVSCSECCFKTKNRSYLIFHVSKHATLTAVFEVTQSNGGGKPEDADREPKEEETQVGQTEKASNRPRVVPSTEILNENRENLQNECLKEKQVEILNTKHQEIQTEGFIEEVSNDTDVLKNRLENCQENKAVFLGSDYLQEKLQYYVVKINGPQESYHCKICRFAMKSKYQLHKHVLRHLNVWMFKCGYCDHKCLESSKLCQHIENRHEGLPYKHVKVGIVELKGRIQRGTKKLNAKLTSNMSVSHVGQWVKDSINSHDDVANHYSNDDENNSSSEKVKLEKNQQTEEIISISSVDDSSSPQDNLSEDQCNKDKTDENKTAEDITVEDRTLECDISAEKSLKDNICQDITSKDSVVKEKSKLAMTSIYQHPKSMLGKTEMKIKLIKMGNIYKCSICGYKSSVQQALAIHVRLHKKEAKFCCQKCSFLTTKMDCLEQHIEKCHGNRDGSESSTTLSKYTEDNSEEESSDDDTRPLTRSLEKNLLEKFGKKLRKNLDSQKINQGSNAMPRELQNSGMSSSPLRNLSGKEWIASKFEEVNNGFKCLLCSRIYSNNGNVVKHIETVCYKRNSVKRDYALFLRKKNAKNSGKKKALSQDEEVKTQSPIKKNLKSQNSGSRQDDSIGSNKNLSRVVSNDWQSWIMAKIKEDGTSFRCRLCRFVSLYRHNLKRHISNAHRKDYKRSNNIQASQQSLAVKKGRTKETETRKENIFPRAKKSLNQGDKRSLKAKTNASQRASGVIRKAGKAPVREEAVGTMPPRDEYFRCNGCKKTFKTVEEVQNHLGKECTEALYHCTLCRLYFSFNEYDVRRHSKMKHGHSITPLLCRGSDRFRRYTVPQTKSSKTKSHVDKNTEMERSVPLDYTQYQQESDFKIPSYSKNSMAQFFCGKCRFMAANAQAFQHHCTSQHKNQTFTCTFCNEFNTLFIVNLRSHTKSKHPKCKDMKFYFGTSKEEVQPQSNAEFSKTISESVKDKSRVLEAGNVCSESTKDCIACIQCNYSGSNLRGFQLHCYKKHTGMSLVCLHCKEYKCHTIVQMSNHCKESHSLCKMKFTFSMPLIDSEVKNISCILPKCGFVTKHSCRYRDHLYNHFNYRPYSCCYCSFTSRKNYLLMTHIQKDHPGKSAKKLIYHKKDYIEKKVKNLIAKSKRLQQDHVTNEGSSAYSKEENKLSKKGNRTFSSTVSGITSSKTGEITDTRRVPKSYYRQKKYSNGKVKFHCLKCPAVYDIVPSITYHVQSNHFPRDIKCQYCSLQFTSKFSFDKHMKQRHPGKPRQCLPPMTPIKSKVVPDIINDRAGSDEGEHTDIYSDDDDTPKRKNRVENVTSSVKKRKYTKKAPSKRKLDSSSSDDSSDDDVGKVRKKPNKGSKSQRQSESDKLSSVGNLKKKVQPIQTSSDESIASIQNTRGSAKKRPRRLASDDESISSSDSKNSDEELQTDCWYRCHMCSYSTNDLRYFSRHLVCHDTFTHFIPGEKVVSPLIDNLNTGNLQSSMFLCSYCFNYEDNLSAMRQHRDRCHPFNVFDCTKVNHRKTEVLVNLQTELSVEDICKLDYKKITQILDEQGIKYCPLIQDESKNDSDSSKDEPVVDITRPFTFSRKRIEVSAISKYLKHAERNHVVNSKQHHGDKDRDNQAKVNDNVSNRHGDKEDHLTSNSEHSLYGVNLPAGGLASIMEAYSGLYEGSSEEDEGDMDDTILEQDLNLNKASNGNLQENGKACEVDESTERNLASFDETSMHNITKSSKSVEGISPTDREFKRNEAKDAFTNKESEKYVTEKIIGCSNDVIDNQVSDCTINRRDCHGKTTKETIEVTDHVKEYTDIEGKGTGDTINKTESEVKMIEDALEHVSDDMIGYTDNEETVMDTVDGCLNHDGKITQDASRSVTDFEETVTDTLNGYAGETTEGTEKWISDDIQSIGAEEIVKDTVIGLVDKTMEGTEESILGDVIGYVGSEETVTETVIGCAEETAEDTEESVSDDMIGYVGSEETVTDTVIGCAEETAEGTDESISIDMIGYVGSEETVTDTVIGCAEETAEGTEESVSDDMIGYVGSEETVTDTVIGCTEETSMATEETVSDDMIGYVDSEETVTDSVIDCAEETTKDTMVTVLDDMIGYVGSEETVTDSVIGCAEETTEGTEETVTDSVIDCAEETTKDTMETVLDDMIGYVGSEETVTDTVIGCTEETTEGTEEAVLDDMIGYVDSEETVTESVIGCVEETTEGTEETVMDDMIGYIGSEETVTDSVIGCAEETTEGTEETVTDSVIGCAEETTEGTEETVLDDMARCVGSEEIVTDSVIGCAEEKTEGTEETVLNDMIGYVGSEETVTDSVIGCVEETTEGTEETVLDDMIGYVGSEETVTDSDWLS